MKNLCKKPGCSNYGSNIKKGYCSKHFKEFDQKRQEYLKEIESYERSKKK